jgi:hypothetical protein
MAAATSTTAAAATTATTTLTGAVAAGVIAATAVATASRFIVTLVTPLPVHINLFGVSTPRVFFADLRKKCEENASKYEGTRMEVLRPEIDKRKKKLVSAQVGANSLYDY